jgi:hypothetical protein
MENAGDKNKPGWVERLKMWGKVKAPMKVIRVFKMQSVLVNYFLFTPISIVLFCALHF